METLGFNGTVESISTMTLAKPIFYNLLVKQSVSIGFPTSLAMSQIMFELQNSIEIPRSQIHTFVVFTMFGPKMKSGTHI